ncbi:MAG: PIN domain-containing protein [Clostridium butyricum]|uniref:PIN domain-containing protein n=1 Tax=Clostridium sp. TaxID=1506 RepID=UPI00290BA01B|nr:PIN domain-containing protein [Clostridium sp.]MDU4589410.1 PIN domain-containing protein [Clostridium sp.]MDU5102311.1 PIN domain-containing protein [Clostridium butyricum]
MDIDFVVRRKTMVNIFIDTNVYIRLLTNEEDRKLFDELKVLVEHKAVQLIIPEIVLLELEKQNKTAQREFENELNKLQREVSEYSKSLWSEVRDVQDKISTLISEEKSKKKIMWDDNYTSLIDFLTSNYVKYIEFTPEIMCKGQKRIIAGRLVRACENSSQDAYNIESIISYLEKNDDNEEVIICSNDIKDFSKDKKGRDGFYELHPILEKNIMNAKCVKTIDKLMKYINYGYEYIDNRELLEKYRKMNLDDDYNKKYEDTYIEELSEKFNKNLLYTEKKVQKIRVTYIKEINNILAECRKLKSWDDRSELKLYSWLEEREESYINISKLSDLILISQNVKDYYNMHMNEYNR